MDLTRTMTPKSAAADIARAAASAPRATIAATASVVACLVAVVSSQAGDDPLRAFASSVATCVLSAALLCRRLITLYGYIHLIQFTERRYRTTYVSWLRRRARSYGRRALRIGQQSMSGWLSRPEWQRIMIAAVVLLMAPSWIFHIVMTAVYYVLRDAWRVLSFTARRPALFLLDVPPQLLLSIMAAGARNAGSKISAAVGLLIASRAATAATVIVAIATVAAVVHAMGRPPAPRPPLRPGERVSYKGAGGTTQDAEVVQVHIDDVQPYYTIRVDGQERSTERARLFRPGEQDTVGNRLHATLDTLREFLRDGMARAALPMLAVMQQTESARGTGRLTTPNDFLCPITYQLMTDPVIAADGHTYEREAIQHWMRQNPGRRALSPKTQIPLANQNLQANIALRGAIEHFMSLNPSAAEEDSD